MDVSFGLKPHFLCGLTPARPSHNNSQFSMFFYFVFILQVEYTYPAHTSVSAGARDLIASLLKHNPVHRLPICGVLTHPWVVMQSNKKPTTLNNDELRHWAPLCFCLTCIFMLRWVVSLGRCDTSLCLQASWARRSVCFFTLPVSLVLPVKLLISFMMVRMFLKCHYLK